MPTQAANPNRFLPAPAATTHADHFMMGFCLGCGFGMGNQNIGLSLQYAPFVPTTYAFFLHNKGEYWRTFQNFVTGSAFGFAMGSAISFIPQQLTGWAAGPRL